MEKVMCCALAALGLSFELGGFLKWEHSYGVTPGPGSWGQWDIHGGLLVPLESCPGHAWSRAGETHPTGSGTWRNGTGENGSHL